MPDIYQILKDLSIQYTKFEHPAVFTAEEAKNMVSDIPGEHIKNLFLRNRKGDKHYLVVVDAQKQVDLKKLGEALGEKLGFASPERMMTYLGVTPGSVTLLGLINDTNKEVVVVLDTELDKRESLQCHPLINTATLVISKDRVNKFLQWRGNEVKQIAL